jgi:fructokinase
MSEDADPASLITVIGEALIDLVPGEEPDSVRARPGGSPYNVAFGLARLGHPTALMARFSDTALGAILRRRALSAGLRLDAAPVVREPTTLAVVSLDADAQASYDFYVEGTADWNWTPFELSRLPAQTRVLHFGSLASWLPPGGDRILDLAKVVRARGDVLVSYDPNLRPPLLGHPDRARPIVERRVAVAHVSKASREDVAWLYPGRSWGWVAAHWLELGAGLVVITGGADGSEAFTPSGITVHRPAPAVAVVDTVGAGDAFTAGLLGALVRRRIHRPEALGAATADSLAGILDEAIAIATITCTRVGADPPTATEAGLAQL